MVRMRRFIALTALLLLAGVANAGAEEILVRGSGTVFEVVDNLGVNPGISTGFPLVFEYRFESTLLDQNADPNIGIYIDSDHGMEVGVVVGQETVPFLCQSLVINVFNDDIILQDLFGAAGRECLDFDADSVVANLGVTLGDLSRTALSSDALPLNLNLDSWNLDGVEVQICPKSNRFCDPFLQGFFIAGSITEISFVPEPSANLLRLVALGVVLGVGRFGRRSPTAPARAHES